MWRYLIPIGLFAALLAFFFVSLNRDKETLPSPLIGKPAPAFELPSLQDPAQRIAGSDFAGKTYLLNVWGTWCIGCRQEHDVLLEIARRGEVPIVGLNWRDDRATAQRWLQEVGNPFSVIASDVEGRVAIDWGVYGAPETFLVNAQGKVIYKHIAPMTLDVWEREFVPLIKQAGAQGR